MRTVNEEGGTGVTFPELAKIIGVTKQRVHKLNEEERIPEAVQGRGGRYTVGSSFPQILRGKRERPGPLTEYIHAWEEATGLTQEENTKT